MQERGAAPPLSGTAAARRWRVPQLALVALVIVAVLSADQITKSWAVSRLSHGPVHVLWKLDFVLTYNSVVGSVALVLVVLLLATLRRVRTMGLALCLAMVLGGALGNLCDRVFRSHHGAVVDFIALHFWPTFNVADSCIVIGVIGAAIATWRAQA
ncbi:MAG: signal peptidase II [Acidimicrobiales bacterium]